MYGSESDYGSEYGMDTGGGGAGMMDEHGQQQMHHNGRHRGGSPSEAGTYHSRYDGGSTLNRYKCMRGETTQRAVP